MGRDVVYNKSIVITYIYCSTLIRLTVSWRYTYMIYTYSYLELTACSDTRAIYLQSNLVSKFISATGLSPDYKWMQKKLVSGCTLIWIDLKA